jgi:hypothetical protein
MRRNPQHTILLTAVSVTPAPTFQPLRHQRNACHSGVYALFYKYFPPQIRNISLRWVLLTTDTKALNNAAFRYSLLKHGRHFYYWNQTLNLRMRVCYPDCHEAGLCCYLVIHIEKALHILQLFYFHLWPICWLSLVLYACGLCEELG